MMRNFFRSAPEIGDFRSKSAISVTPEWYNGAMKNSKRSNFREIGGQVNGYYRYLPGDRAEVMAHFQSREQIEKFTSRLRLRLEAEFDLAALKKNAQRQRARRVGLEAAAEAGATLAAGAAPDQLDLMADLDLIAFASRPGGDIAAARAEAAEFASSRPGPDPIPEKRTARLSFCDETDSPQDGRHADSPLDVARVSKVAKAAKPKSARRARSLSEIRTLGPVGLRKPDGDAKNKKRRDASA